MERKIFDVANTLREAQKFSSDHLHLVSYQRLVGRVGLALLCGISSLSIPTVQTVEAASRAGIDYILSGGKSADGKFGLVAKIQDKKYFITVELEGGKYALKKGSEVSFSGDKMQYCESNSSEIFLTGVSNFGFSYIGGSHNGGENWQGIFIGPSPIARSAFFKVSNDCKIATVSTLQSNYQYDAVNSIFDLNTFKRTDYGLNVTGLIGTLKSSGNGWYEAYMAPLDPEHGLQSLIGKAVLSRGESVTNIEYIRVLDEAHAFLFVEPTRVNGNELDAIAHYYYLGNLANHYKVVYGDVSIKYDFSNQKTKTFLPPDNLTSEREILEIKAEATSKKGEVVNIDYIRANTGPDEGKTRQAIVFFDSDAKVKQSFPLNLGVDIKTVGFIPSTGKAEVIAIYDSGVFKISEDGKIEKLDLVIDVVPPYKGMTYIPGFRLRTVN